MRFTIDEKREILFALTDKVLALNSFLKLEYIYTEDEREKIKASKERLIKLIQRIRKDMEK